MGVQTYRLWPRRPRDGQLSLGLSCDEEGLCLASHHRLVSAALDREGRRFYRAQPLSEINAALSAGYGVAVNAAPLYRAITRIAEYMTRGKWTLATLAAVHLRLPELPDQAAAHRLLKTTATVWDPAKHPRWPAQSTEGHGGEFRPADGGDPLLVPISGQMGVGDHAGEGIQPASLWHSKTPVPFTDNRGNSILGLDGKPMQRPSDVDGGYFIDAGQAAVRADGMPGGPTAYAQLINFAHGNAWDTQRVDGTFVASFRDFANVAIGLYGGSAGIPETAALAIANQAARFSTFGRDEEMDSTYSFLPVRNVYDIRKGYELYQSGRIGRSGSR